MSGTGELIESNLYPYIIYMKYTVKSYVAIGLPLSLETKPSKSTNDQSL